MANMFMDTLNQARVLHAAEVERATTVAALERAYQSAIQENDLEEAARLARMKRDKLLLDVDARGSVYRLELEEPSGSNFSAWLPALRKLVAKCGDEWAEYRRRLLDVPQQEGFPALIEWPEKPEENGQL